MKTVFTDAYIKSIKQSGRYTDAATTGLNLNIKNKGGWYWVFRYLFGGRRLDLSLGAYPAISLKEARKRAIASRNDLLQGTKPKAYWRAETASKELNQPLLLVIFIKPPAAAWPGTVARVYAPLTAMLPTFASWA